MPFEATSPVQGADSTPRSLQRAAFSLDLSSEDMFYCQERNLDERDIEAAFILVSIRSFATPPSAASLQGNSTQEASELVFDYQAREAQDNDDTADDSADEDYQVQSTTPRKRQRSSTKESAKSPKRRRSDESNSSLGDSPRAKVKKTTSAAGEASKAFCLAIKKMPFGSLPAFEPPKQVFEMHDQGLDGGPALRKLSTSISGNFDVEVALRHKPSSEHPTLSMDEQKFVAGFQDKISVQSYQECKRRIFVCARWRTEEDGLHHIKESSQQSCKLNVNSASIFHEWFNNMHLFDQPWALDLRTERPTNMKHLSNTTEGRNGRYLHEGGKIRKTMNTPIASANLKHSGRMVCLCTTPCPGLIAPQ